MNSTAILPSVLLLRRDSWNVLYICFSDFFVLSLNFKVKFNYRLVYTTWLSKADVVNDKWKLFIHVLSIIVYTTMKLLFETLILNICKVFAWSILCWVRCSFSSFSINVIVTGLSTWFKFCFLKEKTLQFGTFRSKWCICRMFSDLDNL